MNETIELPGSASRRAAASPLLDNLELLENAQRVESLWDTTLALLATVGLNRVIYITRAADDPPRPTFLTNMPRGWVQKTGADQGAFDPFLQYCCNSYDATFTGAEFIDDYPYLDERARAFILSASTAGFTAGIAIPTRLIGSDRYGGFNFGCAMGRQDFEAKILPILPSLQAFSLLVHRRLEELLPNDVPPLDRTRLSAREQECLVLIAGGQRIRGVADALQLSESAVRLYLTNARKKLNANTREHAIAKAVAARLIDLDVAMDQPK